MIVVSSQIATHHSSHITTDNPHLITISHIFALPPNITTVKLMFVIPLAGGVNMSDIVTVQAIIADEFASPLYTSNSHCSLCCGVVLADNIVFITLYG